MVNFNDLKESKDEKIDLIQMALNNYTTPYNVSGYDAATLNNLISFAADNLLYKKRKNYTDDDLPNLLYKYSYRYFTQFVTPTATLDLMEMLLSYNKYMVYNIADNSMRNIFGIQEVYTYEVRFISLPTNVNQNQGNTYTFSVPYKSEKKDNYNSSFKLLSGQFNNGVVTNINSGGKTRTIKTDFELKTLNGVTPVKYMLQSNGINIGEITFIQEGYKKNITDKYTNNLIDNIVLDFNNLIDNMIITSDTAISLDGLGELDLLLSEKKRNLKNELEVIKTNGILRNIVIETIAKYCQEEDSVTGLSKMTSSISKQINTEIRYVGMDLNMLHEIFKYSTNKYEESAVYDRDRDIMEAFLQNLFFWKRIITADPLITENIAPTNFNIDTSTYFNVDIDTIKMVTYIKFLEEEVIPTHVSIYLYKYFMLMDIKTIDSTITAEKDKAINNYEINQISENRPITYINVVHKITDNISSRLGGIIAEFDIKNDYRSEYALTSADADTNSLLMADTNANMISLTFQYKELNKDVYDLFLQDQVETYVASWLKRVGNIRTLFNDIYINNFNESVWELASNNDIELYTLYKNKEPNYFRKAKKLVGNPINFREKEYMDIVGYFFSSDKDLYYGMTSEHRQEIALFLRSYQDVREYYFRNLLMKSLVNDDLYPLYEYILLITMAFDRFFSKKISKHKDLDVYTTEDINNFLNSFGLSELNKYDSFYGSFDYKMSVIKNYNNLIKNKGTRKVKKLIENMLNDSNEQYDIAINEYYIAKSTKDSISYVKNWFYEGNIYSWEEDPEDAGVYKWFVKPINTELKPIENRWIITGANAELFTYSSGTTTKQNISEDLLSDPEEGDVYYEIIPGIDIKEVKLFTYLNEEWIEETIPNYPLDSYTWVDEQNINISTIGYEWYDESDGNKITLIQKTDNTFDESKEYINIASLDTYALLTGSTLSNPEDIGKIRYIEENDKAVFINMPEGSNRPITIISGKVNNNNVIEYENFIKDDHYWSKDIGQKFINSASDGLNLNISKTKYLSISASINMEVAKIMNMYVMSILDNILGKMGEDKKLLVESYKDQFLEINDVKYSDLIKYIKFITNHLGDILNPWSPEEPDAVPTTPLKYYGVPTDSAEMVVKLTNFENKLREIMGIVGSDEIDEFLKDKVNITNDSSSAVEITSMNRYAYENNIDGLTTVPTGLGMSYITARNDGTTNIKKENSFSKKLRKLLLGFGYSSVEFKNSAIFILDLLESTNLLSIMEDVDKPDVLATTSKYGRLLAVDNISAQSFNIGNLYSANLRSLLQLLKDYTENRIFKEDYTLKDSSVTNTLAINNAFIKILNLVVETFFERGTSVYVVPEFEEMLLENPSSEAQTLLSDLPKFMKDFIELAKKEDITPTIKAANLSKYNSILNSLNTILSYMSGSQDYPLMETVNTINKNFSDAEYLNFLISLLSFFMSYKVTLYEESHQLDLSNPRETFIFAEDLFIWSEVKLEEDWFFDEEIIYVKTIENEEG